MADHDQKYRGKHSGASGPQKQKCKLCKKRERFIVGNERCDQIAERINLRMRNAASMDRVEVERLRKQRDHVEQVRKGFYCERCIEGLDLWIL